MESSMPNRRRRRGATLYKLAIVVAAASCGEVDAWSSNQKAFRQRKQIQGLTPPGPSQKPSLTSQNMLRNPGNPRLRDAQSKQRNLPKLSNSVLAASDTLPSFPTAHGLLSPEIVMRLEHLKSIGHGSEVLVNFLDQYHSEGPLSCLSYLSDPEVLPHLTRAMRDVL